METEDKAEAQNLEAMSIHGKSAFIHVRFTTLTGSESTDYPGSSQSEFGWGKTEIGGIECARPCSHLPLFGGEVREKSTG